MSKNIVFEGWLTKSPPTKRIWRTKWRRRWFALRQSGDLPGQYFLDYYADRNCRRLKGTINLDLCEQVDAGLHMERAGNGSVDPKLRGSVFTIQTQSRIYHLEADCEEDMEKWVDVICRVCGLRSTEDTDEEMRPYQISTNPSSPEGFQADTIGPYIPISECITGIRTQGRQTATFTFDKNGVISSIPTRRRPERNRYHYASQPHIRRHHNEVSENESNLSEDESNAVSVRNWYVTKSFTKLPPRNPCEPRADGPPVPPRPPKSLSLAAYRENMVYIQRERECYPCVEDPVRRFQEFVELHAPPVRALASPRVLAVPVTPRPAPPSPMRQRAPPVPPLPCTDEDDQKELNTAPASQQYCNLPSLPPVLSSPPAVDRALKPRHASIGHINHLIGHSLQLSAKDVKADTLQYLDLDLPASTPPLSKAQDAQRKLDISHGKSQSCIDADLDSTYKTVDFLKTEAFNITRQDAEASRSNQH